MFWNVGIPEDGDSRVLQNVGTSLLEHIVSQPTGTKYYNHISVLSEFFGSAIKILFNWLFPFFLVSYHVSKFSTSQYLNPSIIKDCSVCSLAQAVQLTISVGVLFSYALQMYVPIQILWPQIQKRWGPFKYNSVTEIIFRSSLVLITCKCVI